MDLGGSPRGSRSDPSCDSSTRKLKKGVLHSLPPSLFEIMDEQNAKSNQGALIPIVVGGNHNLSSNICAFTRELLQEILSIRQFVPIRTNYLP